MKSFCISSTGSRIEPPLASSSGTVLPSPVRRLAGRMYRIMYSLPDRERRKVTSARVRCLIERVDRACGGSSVCAGVRAAVGRRAFRALGAAVRWRQFRPCVRPFHPDESFS